MVHSSAYSAVRRYEAELVADSQRIDTQHKNEIQLKGYY